MNTLLFLALLVFTASCPLFAATVPDFVYPDTETARQHWQPRFGSAPVRVETLPDGSVCLALDADFTQAGDRACWDWEVPLDLSVVGEVSFDVQASAAGLDGTVGTYFGTPRGWYCTFWSGIPAGAWTTRTLDLEALGTEGEPEDWHAVRVFRFSVWAAGPGQVTYRLRNLQLKPRNPHRNLLPNGSFEVECSGIPYAWGSGHWGVGHMPWVADMNLWRERWRLDHSVAYHGQTSLRLTNDADHPLLAAVSVWRQPPRTDRTFAASAWLRSDVDDLPVLISCGEASTTVCASREWTQAVLAGVPWSEYMMVRIAPQAPGILWLDAVQLQFSDSVTGEFHPAAGDEALAVRERAVDWSPPRRSPRVAAGRGRGEPLRPARVQIDAQGRFLLDGQPYVPHCFGLEFVHELAVLDAVAAAGFRDICIEINRGITTDHLGEILDRCASVGLRVIPWLDGNIPRELFTSHITRLRDHPALLAWYVYDEPSAEGMAESEARYRLAKKLDPSHPAYVNYLSNKLEGHVGDIYSTDVYPIPHGTPLDAIRAVARMSAAAAPEGKPVFMWLQGTGFAYWMDREPTPRELSCMVYGSLIAGARGLYYFAQFPRTKACFDEMRALCVEVDALTPVLYDPGSPPPVACEPPAVMCRAYAHGAEVYVLAINTLAAPCEGRFSLPQAAGAVEVVFEDRSLEVRDGGWSDAFGAYERHVYRLSAGGGDPRP